MIWVLLRNAHYLTKGEKLFWSSLKEAKYIVTLYLHFLSCSKKSIIKSNTFLHCLIMSQWFVVPCKSRCSIIRYKLLSLGCKGKK